MRDILVAAIVFGSIPFILRRAYIGVLVYIWLSVMNPHRLAYGFAVTFNFAMIIGIVTLGSALLSRDLKRPPFDPVMVAMCAFVGWTGLTTAFALYPEDSFEFLKSLLKTFAIAALIPMLFHTREQIRLVIWVIVLSIAYYGTKGGVWILLTGGGERVFGPGGSYIDDNNALAVGLVMMVPLMRYLQLTSPHKFVRWGLLAAMAFCVVAIIGSYSRGAFLAVTAMLLFLWWKGRHKLVLLLLAFLAIPPLLAFMPEKWHERMDTIAPDTQETSANMRFNSWATMFNLAKDRPVTGGGFMVAKPDVYQRYSPDPAFPPQVAHSIYFQAMAEHGFVGFGLYLFMLYMLWRQAGWVMRRTRKRPDMVWAHDLAAMMQVTLIGFMVGGAFLSLVNFDVPYYLIGAMVALRAVVERELSAAAAPAEAAHAGVPQPVRVPAGAGPHRGGRPAA